MMSIRSQRTLAFVAFALSGIACAVSPSSEGSGGAGPGSGGESGTGGTVGQGGTPDSGGATGSGGTHATGGTSAAGGRTASGGELATGGASATGGITETGGSSLTGGVMSTGGRTGSGGARATGGATGRDAGSGGTGTGGTEAGGRGGSGGTSAAGGSSGAAATSAGCGKTPTLANGARTISSSGKTRNYMIRIPPNYDNSHPYPLVFAFHWNGGNMNDVDGGGTSGYTWSYYGLREQADNSTNSKMIFVAPDGNGGWPNSGGQDLTFVDDLLKLIEGDLCVDTTRIFSMGFSYGGGMSYAIACARAKVFRAVAIYSGAQLSGCTGGADPIAYIGFHSVSDGTCNYSGGESLRNKFVANNGCTAQTPPRPGSGNVHVCTSYDGCRSGYPVRWCAFDGGGHTPAPVDGSTSSSGGGDRSWTKAEAWKFFTQF